MKNLISKMNFLLFDVFGWNKIIHGFCRRSCALFFVRASALKLFFELPIASKKMFCFLKALKVSFFSMSDRSSFLAKKCNWDWTFTSLRVFENIFCLDRTRKLSTDPSFLLNLEQVVSCHLISWRKHALCILLITPSTPVFNYICVIFPSLGICCVW